MKSFTAILDEALQTPTGGEHEPRIFPGVFLPFEDAPPPAPGSAAERTQALYRELMEETAPEPEAPAPRPRKPAAAPSPSRPTPPPNPHADLEALKPLVAAARSHVALAALRRDFARRHHPDLAPAHRASASARAMREANALIDAAAQRLG